MLALYYTTHAGLLILDYITAVSYPVRQNLFPRKICFSMYCNFLLRKQFAWYKEELYNFTRLVQPFNEIR